MIFTLEVLQAKFGDCLILHYGKKNDPRFIIIDGGPAGVYREYLKPRLKEIKNTVSPNNPLPLSMVMVSHMDDDHVNGVLAMTDDMLGLIEDDEQPLFEMNYFWFNTFDDIVGNLEIPKISSIAASASAADISLIPGIQKADHSVQAVIASTGQGRRLRDNANALSAEVNYPFPKPRGKAKLVRGDNSKSKVSWDTGLSITVVHPNERRLKEYQEKWDKDLKEAKKKGDDRIIIASILDKDKSPFNLSSIVCLVKAGSKTMLLTGDARTDDMLDGLKINKLLDRNGKLHVDILKVPHHGSINNASDAFYEKVTADHYVVSADGKHHNPDKELLDLLAKHVKKGKVYFTNYKGELGLKAKMDKFMKKLVNEGSDLVVVLREDGERSVMVELGDKVSV